MLCAAIGATLRTILARASTQLSVAADGSVVYGASSSSSGSSGGKVNVLNNLDWFGPMSFLDFLRDIGKFARVGQMLAKDSVSREAERRAFAAVNSPKSAPGLSVCCADNCQ
jgi:tyrosyl-tRNA synthetase